MRRRIVEKDLEEVYQRDIPWERLEGKTVLVTGAYGMLASYVVYMLLYLIEKAGMHIQVIAAVRSEEKLRERFLEFTRRSYFKVYKSEMDAPFAIKEDIHYIIHAASLASPQYYKVCPVEVLKPNTVGSYYLLELAAQKNVEGYLFFSSGDIYGAVEGKASISEGDYGAMDTLDIHSCYGESKRMGEAMCRAWQQQKGVPAKIVRICHTYAPTMDAGHDTRVFASFVNDILKKKDIVMKSSGASKRTFCYIADALAAFFLVLFCGAEGEAYNVCNTDEFYSIAGLAQVLAGLYPSLRLGVVRRDRGQGDAYVESSVAGSAPYDNSKLKRLGWETKYGVREGFRRVIEAAGQEKEEDERGGAYADHQHTGADIQ